MCFFGSGFFHSTELAQDSGMSLCGAIVHCFFFLGTYSVKWTDWSPSTCWSTYVFSYNEIIYWRITCIWGFSGGSVGKEPACNVGDARDMGSIPGSGRSPGAGHGNPLQYSCLENPMDRGAWWATVHGVAESNLKPLSTHSYSGIV